MPADNLTTTTQVDPGVQVFYDRVLLKRSQPYLIHELAAQTRNVSKKSGDQIKFRRYASLSPATTPLSEGVTPPGQRASKTDLTAQVKQYGDFLHVSDWVDLTNQDSTLTEFAEMLGEQMGKTRDALCRDILAACASAIDVSGALSTAVLDNAIKTLVNNDAQFVTSLIRPGTGQGSVPVSSAFWAMSSSELLDDWRGINGWIPVRKYAKVNDVQDAEWGAYEQVRVLMSSQGYKDSDLTHPYKIPIVGKNAYGVTEIEGGSAKNIVKPFGSGGTEDPLNQRATSGWKMTYVARILNDNFMLKLDNVSHS
jgi:N4-gp56 family major capsid protein